MVGDYLETSRLIGEFPISSESLWAEMPVVQQDPEAPLAEWVAAYASFVKHGDGWIAFPRVLGDRRVKLIEMLLRSRVLPADLKVHAFGMNAGSLSELSELRDLGVYSCDSSAPVWRGLSMGVRIGRDHWIDMPFDPSWKFTGGPIMARNMQVADLNLEVVLQLCQSKSATP